MPNNVGLRRSFSRFGVVRADSGLVLGLAKTFCIGHRGGVYSRNAPAPVGFRGTPDLRGTASASLSDRFRTSRPDLSPTVNTDCPPRAPQGVFADWSLGLRSRLKNNRHKILKNAWFFHIFAQTIVQALRLRYPNLRYEIGPARKGGRAVKAARRRFRSVRCGRAGGRGGFLSGCLASRFVRNGGADAVRET